MDPTDKTSVLAILEFANTNDVDVGFMTSDTIQYGIESRTNLLGGEAWTNLLNVTGDGFFRQINVPENQRSVSSTASVRRSLRRVRD